MHVFGSNSIAEFITANHITYVNTVCIYSVVKCNHYGCTYCYTLCTGTIVHVNLLAKIKTDIPSQLCSKIMLLKMYCICTIRTMLKMKFTIIYY